MSEPPQKPAWSAGNAVDGNTDQETLTTCTIMDYSKNYKSVWWKVRLQNRFNVAYLEVYFRGSSMFFFTSQYILHTVGKENYQINNIYFRNRNKYNQRACLFKDNYICIPIIFINEHFIFFLQLSREHLGIIFTAMILQKFSIPTHQTRIISCIITTQCQDVQRLYRTSL